MIKFFKTALMLILLNGCVKQNESVVVIDDSTKRIEKILNPVEGITYSTKRIEIKGYSDDSIYVRFGDEGKALYLKSKLDTAFVGDYYGNGRVKFIFDPYKSKKRELKITFKIL